MQFFTSYDRAHTTVWRLHLVADYAYREKAWQQLHKDATFYVK